MDRFRLSNKTYLWSLGYFIVVVILRWRVQPDISILFFYIGGLIGLHLLEIAEAIFVSPIAIFRTVLMQAVLTLLTLFVVTSSASRLGSGIVLFFSLRYILLQHADIVEGRSLASWFKGINISFSPSWERKYLYLVTSLLTLETILFILV